MVISATNEKWGDNKMKDISKQWIIAINPIPWAFAIWGIIYLFLTSFVIYMSIPTSWVPSRNNKLIFGQIGYLFAINFFSQGLWLIVWKKSNPVSFVICGAIISVMLSSGLLILQYSMYE
jgi:hypothetical protein